MKKDVLRKMIGENIRNERLARDLSIDELAEMLGLTPGFVGLIERGKRGATAYTLYQLASILDIHLDQLFYSSTNISTSLAEKNMVHVKRTKLNSVVYDLNEVELDFVISIIKSLKSMQNSILLKNSKAVEDESQSE